MTYRPSPDPDREIIRDDAAARLLERASEIDAAATGATVTELRSAAAEAGIRPSAFDAALAELRRNDAAPVIDAKKSHRGGLRRLTQALGVAVLLGSSAIVASRLTMRGVEAASAPLTEQAFVLRCITPAAAIELVRPIIGDGLATVRYSPAHTPGILVLRATPEQIEAAITKLGPYEGAPSQACPR